MRFNQVSFGLFERFIRCSSRFLVRPPIEKAPIHIYNVLTLIYEAICVPLFSRRDVEFEVFNWVLGLVWFGQGSIGKLLKNSLDISLYSSRKIKFTIKIKLFTSSTNVCFENEKISFFTPTRLVPWKFW